MPHFFVHLSWLHTQHAKLMPTYVLDRAGELSAKELEELMVIVSNPRTFKIPDWFLNRQKDHKDGRFSQLTSSALDTKLREDLERLKKIRYKPAASKVWLASLMRSGAPTLPSS